MQINDIKALVARLEAIVEGWDEKSGAPAVERHIAASLLAELYEAVKFDTALAATPIAKVEESAPILTEEVAEPEEESVSEVIDLSDIFGGSSYESEEPEGEVEEPAEEVVVTIEEEPIEESAEEPAPLVEEVVPAVEQPEITPEVEEQVEEQPAVEEELAADEPKSEVEVEQTEVVEPTDEQPREVVTAVEQPAEELMEQPTVIEVEQPAEVKEENVIAEEDKPATVEEQFVAEEDQSAEEVAEQSTSTEEEQPKSEQASLFDMEIVRRPRSSSGRRVIMSLYGESSATSRREKKEEKKAKSADTIPASEQRSEQDSAQEPASTQSEPIVEPTSALVPEVAETPIAVSVAERIAAAQADGSQVLGDVIGAGTTTLADAMAASQPTVQTVQNDRVDSLRNLIGINDRFIMIRDLFGGDGAAFDRAMDELDAFDDFNECLVYMSEYRWNPNSDGARMLMDLVTRKLL